jgi:hypothetical protein
VVVVVVWKNDLEESEGERRWKRQRNGGSLVVPAHFPFNHLLHCTFDRSG